MSPLIIVVLIFLTIKKTINITIKIEAFLRFSNFIITMHLNQFFSETLERVNCKS